MIVMSNGFNRFILATAAAEVAKAGKLGLFITGPYPTPAVEKWIDRLGLRGARKLGRLTGRKEAIPPEKIRPLWASEAIYAARVFAGPLRQTLTVAGMQAYCDAAARLLPQAVKDGARVYHYRAGFGGRSIAVARDLGMVTICDHSIVHPAFVASLAESRGRLDLARVDGPMVPVERHILKDFDEADHLVVNSDFVRQTFLRLGYSDARISVVPQGIDDGFLRMLPESPPARHRSGPLRLLAPSFSERKGAPTLAGALAGLDDVDWELSITRSIEPEMHGLHKEFLADPRVHCSNPERRELAALMAEHDVVVFPTYAEGSARVIFEALAAGAYVITTPNAGSVVQDGVNGRLIPPGDEEAVRVAIREVAHIRDRLPEIAQINAHLVRQNYSQQHYGEGLLSIYEKLLGGK
jgi:glycosyltransferase involved in cell wall biosynthesis